MSAQLIYIKWLWGVMNAIVRYTRDYTDWGAETAKAYIQAATCAVDVDEIKDDVNEAMDKVRWILGG
jgi:hypothetical protein